MEELTTAILMILGCIFALFAFGAVCVQAPLYSVAFGVLSLICIKMTE